MPFRYETYNLWACCPQGFNSYRLGRTAPRGYAATAAAGLSHTRCTSSPRTGRVIPLPAINWPRPSRTPARLASTSRSSLWTNSAQVLRALVLNEASSATHPAHLRAAVAPEGDQHRQFSSFPGRCRCWSSSPSSSSGGHGLEMAGLRMGTSVHSRRLGARTSANSDIMCSRH